MARVKSMRLRTYRGSPAPRLSPSPPPTKPKKKRTLNQKALPTVTNILETPPALIETPIEPIPTTKETSPSPPPIKRSVLAASEAITKREREKKRLNDDTSPISSPIPSEEKKPIVKKKRKLNIKKVVMAPNSTSSPDELCLESSINSYSKYLNTKEGKIAPIVIDIKKRKMVQRSNEDAGPSVKTVPVNNQQLDTLDLSHHSIIPNSSYVSHISSKQRLSVTSTAAGHSDDSCNISVQSESSDEFFDALSEFEDEEIKEVYEDIINN